MKFNVWNPIYQKILDDFGFDRIADGATTFLLDAGIIPDIIVT